MLSPAYNFAAPRYGRLGVGHGPNADWAATIKPMRRNASTVVVLAGSAPGEVLAAVGRSMNVTLIRPEEPADPGGDGIVVAAGALQRAGRATAPYALVAADPLAAVAVSWRAMWDVSRQEGPAEFEQEAAKTLAAWRAGRFELPDYYLVLATSTGTATGTVDGGDHGPDFHLGPLRSARPHRVAVVAAAEPAQQAVGVLQALGSLRHGPWWPALDEVIETARSFYPDSLAESQQVTALLTGECLTGGLIVVPDDGIRSVDLTQRADVASFQRGEETDDRVVGRKPCPSGRGKPGLRGTRSGRALRRASREIPEVSARLFDISGPVSVFTVGRTLWPHRSRTRCRWKNRMAHRYRLCPDEAQEAVLLEHCAHARFVWNLAVEQQSWWRPGRGSTPSPAARMRQLAEARAAEPWLAQG